MARVPIFEIAETSEGMFELSSSDFAPFTGAFESSGLDGGGYDWERIALHLLEQCEPSLLSEITFNSEASMFSAYAENRRPLTRLMDLMRETLRSKKRLSIAITESKSEETDAPELSHFPFVVLVYFEGYVPEVETIYKTVSQSDDSDQQAEGACCGGGESVVFVRTQNVDKTFECCLAALRDAKLLSCALIGSKAAHDDEYSVLWPKRDGRVLKPTLEP